MARSVPSLDLPPTRRSLVPSSKWEGEEPRTQWIQCGVLPSVLGYYKALNAECFYEISREGWDSCGLGRTYLVFIPKKTDSTKVEHFRPIALCSVIYKILSKVLVNRIKLLLHELVDPTQSAFVLDRNIDNNILISNKLAHTISKSRKPDSFGFAQTGHF